MINIKESFEVLCDGLSLFNVNIDPNNFRKLKFKDPKCIDIVQKYIQEIKITF